MAAKWLFLGDSARALQFPSESSLERNVQAYHKKRFISSLCSMPALF